MPIITISRDSYAHGLEIAEKVAERLGLESLGREVVFEAARDYGVDEDAIAKALHDAPSFLERLSSRKERHVAMFQAALLRHVRNGKVVYHGLAGHFLLAEVPHVLRVRVVADFEERVLEEVRREGVDEDTARVYLRREDEERARWAKHLYGVDYRHPEQYDMCLNLGVLRVDDAVEVIVAAAGLPTFQDSAAQERRLADLVVAAEAEVRLLEDFRQVQTSSIEGKVRVRVRGPMGMEQEISDKVRNCVGGIEGAKSVCVDVSEEMKEDD